ncbi:RHS repeat-associated core domain-containing protein [Rhizobium ruizarguesonis]
MTIGCSIRFVFCARLWLALILLLVSGLQDLCWSDDSIPGTLQGEFSVSLGGSAQYGIPIAVPDGTSGMSPKLTLSYDSNSGAGNLGIGWSILGLSSITRTPKTIMIDGEVSPVTYTDTDGLVLDGSRLVPVGSNGPNSLFSKLVDDQARIEEVKTAKGPYFISRTKAGLRLYYGAVTGSGPDGRIRVGAGKIVAWPCVRVEDTFGNYISFEYQTNGFGDWGLASAKYTGNDLAGLAPYAELRIKYSEAKHPTISYLGGEELKRSLVVETIESTVHGQTFRNYKIEYEDTERLGSRRIRLVTETGARGAFHRPTIFNYDDPNPRWEEQTEYQLPTEFGSLVSLEDGYRIIDLDADGVREIVYSANFIDATGGGLRPFRSTYKWESGGWNLKPDLALPVPLATSAGGDAGAFFVDIDGDKLLDLIVASKAESDPLMSKGYRQESGKWVEKAEFAFPDAISASGKRVLILRALTLPTGESGVVSLNSTELDPTKRLSFWSHDGSKWVASPILSVHPFQATALLDGDLDCDGKADLIAVDEGAGSIVAVSIAKNANGDFEATVPASSKLGEPIIAQVASVTGCSHLIARTLETSKLLDVSGATGGVLDSKEISISGVSVSDIDRFIPAAIDSLAGEEILLRLRATPKLDTAVLEYDPAAKNWKRLGDYDRSIQDESERLSSGFLPVSVDTDGDGDMDIVLLPTTQVLPSVALVNNAPGWELKKQFVPGIAFAQKDKLGVAPQFVDLNGDSLVDLVGNFKDETGVVTKAASINTAAGWVGADEYITPEPLTNQKSGTTGVLVDITSDGIADFVYSFAGVHKLWTNKFEIVDGKETARYWVEDPNFPPPPEDFSVERYGDHGVRFADVNGDGRVDVLVARRENDGSLYSRAYINAGNSWAEQPKFRLSAPFVSRYPNDITFETPGSDYYRDLRGQLIDINGDGLLDYAFRYRFTPSLKNGAIVVDPKRQCQNRDRSETKNGKTVLIPHPIPSGATCAGALINSGKGWIEAGDEYLPVIDLDADVTRKTASVDVLDINADGLPDILLGQPGGGQTFLSTGRGWRLAPSYNEPGDVVSTNEKLNDHRFLDLNADGLVDLAFSRPGARGAYLNTGYGWMPSSSLAPPVDLIDSEGKDLGVRIVDVDGNGHPDVLRSWKDKDGKLTRSAYLNMGGRADTMRAAINGLGLRSEFAYRSLLQLRSGEPSETQFYTPSPVSAYPVISQAPTMYAVQKMTVVESDDRKRETVYQYKGFRFDVSGATPLGFESRTATSLQDKMREDVELHQSYFLSGRTKEEKVSHAGTNLSDIKYNYDVVFSAVGAFPVRVVMKESNATRNDLNGSSLGTISNSFNYDEYNNALSSCVVYGDGSWAYTANEYNKTKQNFDPAVWYLGRLTRSNITHATSIVSDKCVNLSNPGNSVPSKDYSVKVATFEYDQSSGVIAAETSNASELLSLTKRYTRDKFGNVIRTESRDNYYRNIRFSVVDYDSEGRFIVAERNALDHNASRALDDVLGVVLTPTDPNGVQFTSEYDGFGGLRRSISPTGVQTVKVVDWAGGETVDGQKVVFKTIERVGQLPPTETWLDIQGRVLRVTTIGTEDKVVVQDTRYDNLGRVIGSTLPYFQGEETLWATTIYDDLGRPVKKVRPDGAEFLTAYDGLVVTNTDPLLHSVKKITNAKGLVTKTIDQAGGELQFEYGPDDQLLRTIQVDGQESTFEYDNVGNKIAAKDLDLGRWEYRFNAFGEVVWQCDAKGQITTVEYDAVGRPLARVTPDKRISWVYDEGEFAKGAVSRIESSDGYSEDFKYDRYGRVERYEARIEGELYATTADYDEYNRIRTTFYPGGFAVRNGYDSWGFLARLESSDPDQPFGTWQKRWVSIKRDQYGRVRQEGYGNGLITSHVYNPRVGYEEGITAKNTVGQKIVDLGIEYDLVGNLREKVDSASKRRETFYYDTSYRLESWKVNGQEKGTYKYDAAGRIKFKSDIGYYKYDPTKPSHGVSSISNKNNGPSKWIYEYDPNGNMVFSPKGHFEYYSDNSVRQIISSSDEWSSFKYTPGGSRYLHEFRDGQLLTRTATTGAYEKISEFVGVGNTGKPDFVRHRIYISADTGVVAVLERTTQYDPYLGEKPSTLKDTSASDLIAKLTTSAHYLTKDQLGSITHITDAKGVATVSSFYDPWGKRDERPLTDKTPGWPGENIDGSFHRGFTGHEQLDHLELIHMNGRVYDPSIGRFVSADPTLQFPLMSQNYDRFAYVGNNPLRFTDPNGFGWFSDFVGDVWDAVTSPFKAVGKWLERNWRTVVVVVVAVAITYFSAGTLGPVAAGMLAGAASSGLGTALYGGSLSDVMESAFKGAVIGGISAGFAYGIGEMGFNAYGAAVAHGVSQGGLNAMQGGGNFWQSFAAGAFGSLAGSYMQSSDYFRQADSATKIGASAVVGGTSSAIGGGKFENGAVTGAFVEAFNHIEHEEVEIQRQTAQSEPDPYSLDDAFSGGLTVNVGSSVGVGAKVYDVFGEAKLGVSTSCCGGGPGVGSDTVFGGDLFTPNVGVSAPLQLGSISYGGTINSTSINTSVAIRVGPIEVSNAFNVNMVRLYQRVEQSIYRLYSVPYYGH